MSSPLEITLATQIGIAATQTTLTLEELIVSMKAANASDDIIRQTLLNDLENSGRIFGAFKNKIKSTVRNAIESSANTQSTKEFEQAGVQRYRWQTVGKNICPDCEERNGLTGTDEYFNLLGKPKSGFSVCGANCNCKVLPIGYKGEGLGEPIKRAKK